LPLDPEEDFRIGRPLDIGPSGGDNGVEGDIGGEDANEEVERLDANGSKLSCEEVLESREREDLEVAETLKEFEEEEEWILNAAL
jgi:hypothetical protein